MRGRKRGWRTQIFLSFCRWTSVRGLQHVVRSQNLFSKATWAIFVTLMFLANVVLISLLLIRYCRYNTVEVIRTLRRVAVPFPAVTVCNVDPINTERIACYSRSNCSYFDPMYNNKTVYEHFLKAEELMKSYQDSSVFNQLEDSSKISILYQIIGLRAAANLGHQLEDAIIDEFCQVTTVDSGGIFRKMNCSQAGVDATLFSNYKFFNCYTLSMKNASISTRAVRLSLVMYLDMETALTCRPHCTHEFTEWAGGKAVIHPQSTYPNIDRHGMNLLPGASNQILISETKERQFTPNNCRSVNNLRLRVGIFNTTTHLLNTQMMHYSEELCILLATQRFTMTKCHCADFIAPIPGDLLDQFLGLPYCGDLSQSNVSEALKCSQTIHRESEFDVQNECRLACTHTEYSFELTQLRWPQKPQVLHYYKSLRNHSYYERKFKVYEKIEQMIETNPQAAERQLAQTDVFEQNFLQLDVNRPAFDTLISLTENEEYTLPTLMSQIGGICSAFLSFTCVTVLELAELAVRLFLGWWRSRKGVFGSNGGNQVKPKSMLKGSKIDFDGRRTRRRWRRSKTAVNKNNFETADIELIVLKPKEHYATTGSPNPTQENQFHIRANFDSNYTFMNDFNLIHNEINQAKAVKDVKNYDCNFKQMQVSSF